MLLKCLCGGGGQVSGGEVVQAARPEPENARPPTELPSEGNSLSGLRAEGEIAGQRFRRNGGTGDKLSDVKVTRAIATAERQIQRLEARNARQMARVMRDVDARSAHMASIHQALSKGLDRITTNPQCDAEAEAQLQQLQDEIDLERRLG